MGWINEFEQQHILSLYGKKAEFRCDHCRMPIFIDQLYVANPKGGAQPRPKDLPSFIGSPRYNETYHSRCDMVLKGKPVPDNEITMVDVKKGSAQKKKAVEHHQRKQVVKKAQVPVVEMDAGSKNGKVPTGVRSRILAAMQKRKKHAWFRKELYKIVPDAERREVKLAVKKLLKKGLVRRKGHQLVLGRS
jgi:hypothetical protein